MARKLVSVDDALHLPPAVQAQLRADLDSDFASYVSTAQTAASNAGNSATTAAVARDVAVEAAASAAAPTVNQIQQVLGLVTCQGFTRAAVIACLDAAEAKGAYTVAYFPPGTYDVGDGLSMSGRTAQIRGAGAAESVAGPKATTFYASTQTGPVLDFTDYVVPRQASGQVFGSRITFEGFSVRGSGVADSSKVRSGIRLKSMSSATFRDIAISQTGGPCIEGVSSPGDAVYLCDFERVIMQTPVSAGTNDVPYMILNEPNGNRFRGLGFRSPNGTNDCGVSGALVVTDNANYSGYQNVFDGCWFEYLHVPTNGSLVSVALSTSRLHEFGWHDCSKVAGATNTAFVRIRPATVQNYGGNIWSGLVPGNGGGPTEIDRGIVVTQSNNRIEGSRGFSGNNVQIASGVTNTFVSLGGSMSTPSGTAVQDDSGNTTNVIFDASDASGRGRFNRLAATNLLLSDPASPTSGRLTMGSAVLDAAGPVVSFYGNALRVYNAAGSAAGALQLAAGPIITSGAGSPEGVVSAPPGSLYLNTSGGASTSLYVKQSGTGATGWAGK